MTRSRTPSGWRPAVVGAALFAAACAAPGFGLYESRVPADILLYREFAEKILAGGIPYRTFSLEYPPGALPAFVLPALPPGESYALLFKLAMAACGAAAVAAVAVALVAAGADRRHVWGATAFAALAPLALGPTTLHRYDLWPVALVAVALALLVRGGLRLPLALLALAATAKVYAVVLAPLVLLWLLRRQGREAAVRAGAWFCGVGLAIVLPFLAVGPGGMRHTALQLLERPLQVESLGGSLVVTLERLGVAAATVRTDYGSQNVYGAAAGPILLLTTALGLATVLAALALFARAAPSTPRLFLAAAAAVSAFVAFGKVLSPQYLLWLVPLVPLVGRRAGVAAAALLLSALALTRGWFPDRYADVVELGPASSLVLARNALLVALVLVLLVALGLRRDGNA